MTLNDTVAGMCSDDYKERLKAEYYQARIRHDKLLYILMKEAKGELPFRLTCPKEMLWEQLGILDGYIKVLLRRLKAENIEIEKISVLD